MKEIYAYARTEMFKTNGFTAIAVNNGDDNEKAEKTYAGGTIHIGNIHANELSAFLNFVESITEEYEEHLNIHIAGFETQRKSTLRPSLSEIANPKESVSKMCVSLRNPPRLARQQSHSKTRRT